MREYIRFWTKKDFKIGLQLGVEKLSISRADEHVTGIDDWVTHSVVTQPILGFVYRSDDGKKKLFRPANVQKYSDETMSRIVNTIMHHKRSEFVHLEPAD